MASLLSSVVFCWLIPKIPSLAISNTVYVDKATAFLHDLQSFYSGEDRDSFASHIADDFIWRWESESTVGKDKFIALNKDFHGHYTTANLQYVVDAIGNKYCTGVSYAFLSKVNTPTYECKSWLSSYELFIFNDEQQIQQRYSFPVEKRIYEKDSKILNHKRCRKPKDTWDYEAEDALLGKMHSRLSSFYNHTLLQYLGRLQDTQLFLEDIADGFSWYHGAEYNEGTAAFIEEMERYSGMYDQVEIKWETDVGGQGYAAGYLFTMMKKGECSGVFAFFVVAYFDWDVDKITHLAQFPVDEEALREFEKCIQWVRYEKKEL